MHIWHDANSKVNHLSMAVAAAASKQYHYHAMTQNTTTLPPAKKTFKGCRGRPSTRGGQNITETD